MASTVQVKRGPEVSLLYRTAAIALLFAACTGSPPPEKAQVKALQAPVKAKTEVRKAKALTKAPTEVKKLSRGKKLPWAPNHVVTGVGGRRCTVFKDRVIVTRPAGNEWEMRVRPVDVEGNLDQDCKWDGPVMVQGRVDGEVMGAIWPHVALAGKPMFGGVGARLQIMNGNTGGITADVVSAAQPFYARSLVVGFRLPIPADIELAEGEVCTEAIQKAWDAVYADLEAGGRITPAMSREAPQCPPSGEETCSIAFMLPYELVMSEQKPRQVQDVPPECTDAGRI